uniref:Uncharacterized protein n=1 Tax=Siphoviridae sp. ctBLh2 TaxID=2827803 RepID=A0A8S5S4J0_9CAUD|nr:MAG TPA: hypothetical protein [Siphoviridae sp. ctBLh2]
MYQSISFLNHPILTKTRNRIHIKHLYTYDIFNGISACP